MNFLKKALLGLLMVNCILGSQLILAVEEEQEEEIVSTQEKIAATVLGLGVATFVAYKYGAFNKDAFLRNNKVSQFIAKKATSASNYVYNKAVMPVANKFGYLLPVEKPSLWQKIFSPINAILQHIARNTDLN